MKLQNKSAKGKWIHVKINGFSYKKWLAAYDTINLPEVTSLSQLNLNSHEEAMIHEQAHIGIDPDPTPEFYFVVSATKGATGGTTSLSGGSVSVAEAMNLSFSVYPQVNYYLSAYTINGTSMTISTPSATTVYTLSNITQDRNIYVAFSRYGS
jgi:hypothetical protein